MGHCDNFWFFQTPDEKFNPLDQAPVNYDWSFDKEVRKAL